MPGPRLREAVVAATTIAAVNVLTGALGLQAYESTKAFLAHTATPVDGSRWTETEEVFDYHKYVAAQFPDGRAFACVLNPRVELQADSAGWSSVESLVGAANDKACPEGSRVMPDQVNQAFLSRLADGRTYWDTAMERVEGLAIAPTFSFPKSSHSYTGAALVTKVGDAALFPDDKLVIANVYNGEYGSNGYQYGPGQCLLGEGDAGKAEVRDYGKVPYGAGFLSVGVVTNSSNLGPYSCPEGSLILGSTRKD